MKLLRDFLRLRAPRRSLFAARRDARRAFVVTVPAPLAAPSVEPQRHQAETRVVAPLSSSRHLQLASSH